MHFVGSLPIHGYSCVNDWIRKHYSFPREHYKQPLPSSYCFYRVIFLDGSYCYNVVQFQDGSHASAVESVVDNCPPTDVITVHIWRHSTRRWRHQLWKQWAGSQSTGDRCISTDGLKLSASERRCRTEDWQSTERYRRWLSFWITNYWCYYYFYA